MDSKALYNLSYGVFVLGARNGEKINACITNTCIQVASEPVRIAISVLDKSCTFDLIKNFGFQSGRDVNKFYSTEYKLDKNQCPYITSHACSLLSCKVLSSQDLGTHTLFIAEVEDAQVLSSNQPVTYADYQKDIKPKPAVQSDTKIVGWRCKICGYVYNGAELPKDFTCPLCGHPAEDFEPIYEN